MKQRMMTIRIGGALTREEKIGAPAKVDFDFYGERRSKGVEWRFRGRRKRNKADFATTRWRIMENVVNVLLGAAIAAGLFWCGWLVGSGVVVF